MSNWVAKWSSKGIARLASSRLIYMRQKSDRRATTTTTDFEKV